MTDLRYGINPHQHASMTPAGPMGSPVRVLGGAASYINLLDALNAWQLVHEAAPLMQAPVATSFKHVSPAGAAAAGVLDPVMRDSWRLGTADVGPLASAYLRARDTDPKSSFGDLIAVSEPVDEEFADLLTRVIADGVVAPGYEPGTVGRLAGKKGGRFLVLEADPAYTPPPRERRDVFGLTFEQDVDRQPITPELLQPAVGDSLAPAAARDALLGMVVLRYTQSNSVVYVRDGMTLGVGAGQQSRIDCTRLAGAKADVWWRRRHPYVTGLRFVPGRTRQERLNWRVLAAQGDLTQLQRTALAEALAGGRGDDVGEPTSADWADWATRLSGVTVAHDGFIPFRDNIDEAARHGAATVVEPGGSTRTGEVEEACRELGLTLVRTGLRLFHH